MKYLKVLIVGDSGVGKTSLMNAISLNNFNPKAKASICCEFAIKGIEVSHTCHQLQLWDLAGQDHCLSLPRLYCRDSHGALVVAEVTNAKSLQTAQEWKKLVD